MKLVRAGNHFVCHLSKGEQAVLWNLLKLYPCISSTARTGLPGKNDSSMDLLEEALSEQRNENRKRVHTFLGDERRFADSDQGFQFSVSASELDWLLQILNDVRIGNWILLGSPEGKLEPKSLDEKTAPHFWAMEMAGHFEMHFLSALRD